MMLLNSSASPSLSCTPPDDPSSGRVDDEREKLKQQLLNSVVKERHDENKKDDEAEAVKKTSKGDRVYSRKTAWNDSASVKKKDTNKRKVQNKTKLKSNNDESYEESAADDIDDDLNNDTLPENEMEENDENQDDEDDEEAILKKLCTSNQNSDSEISDDEGYSPEATSKKKIQEISATQKRGRIKSLQKEKMSPENSNFPKQKKRFKPSFVLSESEDEETMDNKFEKFLPLENLSTFKNDKISSVNGQKEDSHSNFIEDTDIVQDDIMDKGEAKSFAQVLKETRLLLRTQPMHIQRLQHKPVLTFHGVLAQLKQKALSRKQNIIQHDQNTLAQEHFNQHSMNNASDDYDFVLIEEEDTIANQDDKINPPAKPSHLQAVDILKEDESKIYQELEESATPPDAYQECENSQKRLFNEEDIQVEGGDKRDKGNDSLNFDDNVENESTLASTPKGELKNGANQSLRVNVRKRKHAPKLMEDEAEEEDELDETGKRVRGEENENDEEEDDDGESLKDLIADDADHEDIDRHNQRALDMEQARAEDEADLEMMKDKWLGPGDRFIFNDENANDGMRVTTTTFGKQDEETLKKPPADIPVDFCDFQKELANLSDGSEDSNDDNFDTLRSKKHKIRPIFDKTSASTLSFEDLKLFKNSSIDYKKLKDQIEKSNEKLSMMRKNRFQTNTSWHSKSDLLILRKDHSLLRKGISLDAWAPVSKSSTRLYEEERSSDLPSNKVSFFSIEKVEKKINIPKKKKQDNESLGVLHIQKKPEEKIHATGFHGILSPKPSKWEF